MKKGILRICKIALICICSCAVFVATGYFYLGSRIEKTENYTSEEPYTSAEPQNAGVLIDICGSTTFFYLDFEKKEMMIFFPYEKVDTSCDAMYGYSLDYNIIADYSFVSDIIDFIDGIEMQQNGETLRYTGVQVADMLSRAKDNSELKRTVVNEIINRIAQKGFEKSNYLYIIENSETNLTVPDCYFWADYMKELCKNRKFIN